MPKNLFSIKNQNVLITGASRGLGLKVANSFFEYGSNVLGLSKNKQNNNQKFNFELRSVDINNIKKINIALTTFLDGNKLDTLINFAGITIEGSTDEIIRKNIETNLIATLNLNLLAKQHMKNGGSIINITSLAAHRGFPNNPGYAASKGGLHAASKALAVDFAPFKIRINTIVPGYLKTDMTKKSWEDKTRRKNIENQSILGRWGNPEDIVGTCIFLASNASSFITGQSIRVDGGWLSKGLF